LLISPSPIETETQRIYPPSDHINKGYQELKFDVAKFGVKTISSPLLPESKKSINLLSKYSTFIIDLNSKHLLLDGHDDHKDGFLMTFNQPIKKDNLFKQNTFWIAKSHDKVEDLAK
jgi:hypothetical protein